MLHVRSGMSLLASAVATLCLATGCASSPWESEFRAACAPVASLTKDAPIRIREVEWDRVQTTLREISSERAASDTHPDDWPQEKKDAELNRLLKGLQIQGSAPAVRLLGRSDFRTTARTRPDDGTLEEFARRIGATTVIWTSSYLGKADSVRQESITEYRTGTADRWRSGNHHAGAATETATVYFPVVVRADEYAFSAFFLRED